MIGQVCTATGRRIVYSDNGPMTGLPVVLCHGLPGAHVQIPNHTILTTHQVRVIIIDRPGFGQSDPHPSRTLASWHEDLLLVLDTLGIAQCVLWPFSAGTPYALSFTAAYPHRVSRLFVVSGMAPNTAADIAKMAWFHRFTHSFGNAMPTWVNHVVASAANVVIGKGVHAGRFGMWLMRNVFTAQENQYAHSPAGQNFRDMLAESFAQGYHSYLEDLHIITQPWDVDLHAITHPVTCWYGDSDHITPPNAGIQLHTHLPQTQMRVFPRAGHLLIFMQWDECIAHLAHKE